MAPQGAQGPLSDASPSMDQLTLPPDSRKPTVAMHNPLNHTQQVQTGDVDLSTRASSTCTDAADFKV
jgi:hypothetical protein